MSRKIITGGVLAAAVTPRRSREHSIDLGATLELIDFLGEGGVDGIALLGPVGEFTHFALEDRARMLDFAIKRSRVPVMVNVSHPTLDGAVFLALEAAGSGVAAVMLMPPSDAQYDQDALREFGLRFADEVAKQVPAFLAEMPDGLMGTGLFAGEIVRSMASDGDVRNVFIADDRLYRQSREAGAAGGVSITACAAPELMASLDRAVRASNQALIEKLDARVQQFGSKTEGWPDVVVLKEALKQRKIKTGSLAIPLSADGEQKLAGFGAWFKDWLREVLKECRT